MKLSITLLAVSAISLIGCFGSKKVAESPKINSNEAIVAKAQSKFPGYTVSQYETGQKLYETNCNKCHALKTPKNYSEEEWAKLVPSMSKKANEKKGSDLTEEDQILIYNYVVAVSI